MDLFVLKEVFRRADLPGQGVTGFLSDDLKPGFGENKVRGDRTLLFREKDKQDYCPEDKEDLDDYNIAQPGKKAGAGQARQVMSYSRFHLYQKLYRQLASAPESTEEESRLKKKTESGGGGIPVSGVGRLDVQHNATPGLLWADNTFSSAKQAMCRQSRRTGQGSCIL